ncbi:site-2 protease [Thermosporothrix hazakensis]|jgi:regulator of sigma E protease|uniref:Site-2 protease n=2 Tax=Thermosporothrix TaxID=768650 RepID=A0A326U355_THEHA|nr:M50 family metallopeptidase [Thermosporothrix hazakensis]PZW25460.1 site-2 protease [Thermosporothrix hazakensis]BBH90796.1 zinc metalloprotease [Thermosporothrix sp. COM3]GCE48846.1 zinc metalloprotease [Thermosporothrix hazakensis]
MNPLYILAVIPVLGLLVFIHELGHFLAAKWSGIRVEEFGLGLPPRIVGIRRNTRGRWEFLWFGQREEHTTVPGEADDDRTIYSINLLPIGGFVRMTGENGEETEDGIVDPKSFMAKSAGKRFITLIAGVVMNFILAILLFTIAFGPGMGIPKDISTKISEVQPNTPAEKAGLHPGDTILAVNGHAVENMTQTTAEMQNLLKASNNPETVPIQLTIRRANSSQTQTITVEARKHPPKGQGSIGIVNREPLMETVPLWQAPLKGIQYTFSLIGQIFQNLGQLFLGRGFDQLAGPVGIAQSTGEIAQNVPRLGWGLIFAWTASLSLSLAVMNSLPFPALDGGRILLILIEVLRGGKRIKPEREALINLVGFAALILLMIVITINDIRRW